MTDTETTTAPTADPWADLRQALAHVSAYLNGQLGPDEINWSLRRIEDDVPALIALLKRPLAIGNGTYDGVITSIGAGNDGREWAVRWHSPDGPITGTPTSRQLAEAEFAQVANWHDPDGQNPPPPGRLELISRPVGPWRSEKSAERTVTGRTAADAAGED